MVSECLDVQLSEFGKLLLIVIYYLPVLFIFFFY
jgi:hypothetical protein